MTEGRRRSEPETLGPDHYRCQVPVVNEMGLHARPASLLVGLAMKYENCSVSICNGDHCVDGKSILQLLSLSAEAGVNLTVETRGVEARSALDALTKLIEDGFHELPGSTSPAPNPSS